MDNPSTGRPTYFRRTRPRMAFQKSMLPRPSVTLRSAPCRPLTHCEVDRLPGTHRYNDRVAGSRRMDLNALSLPHLTAAPSAVSRASLQAFYSRANGSSPFGVVLGEDPDRMPETCYTL